MEDRIKKLETITSRLSRREKKTKTAIISPYPISNAVIGDKVDGVVLTYMFPCPGTISKGAIVFDKKPKQLVEINISISDDELGSAKTYKVDKKKTIVDLDIVVNEFSKLTVSILPTGEDILKEVWASFLWAPTIKDVVVKSFLIDELENDMIKGD